MLVSVIVVTYNPRWDLLDWALDSLEGQTLSKQQFEVVIVDNNSTPPLTEERLNKGRHLNIRLLREPRQGNTFARCLGISEAHHELCVFVDDDNHLDADYLENARRIASQQPTLGAFGGLARPVLEAPLASWKAGLLPYLGIRDFGETEITSNKDEWGKWEPIGAGMVFRRDVGLEFVRWVAKAEYASLLGRKGTKLMSGEDSLLARTAYRLGYFCSYQPELKMSHCMKAKRLGLQILAGTMVGHGRSYVLLEQIVGRPIAKPGRLRAARELAGRYVHRVKSQGLRAGTLEWFWDVGYFQQALGRD